METILITTGNGMFGRAVTDHLLKKDVKLKVMVRDISKVTITDPKAEVVVADMDKPETIAPVMKGVSRMFLSSPMDSKIAEREMAMIGLAKENGVGHIVKIFGSVKHEGDELSKHHGAAFDFLKQSGIPYTLISPNSVMETSLLSYGPSIKYMHRIYGMSEHGKIGLVSLDNCAEAAAVALTGTGHEGQNYELTGPESIDMYEVAERFSNVLGRKIQYIDLGEEGMKKMVMRFDKTMTEQNIEMNLLCHLRAWKAGRADMVTDTYEKLTGKKPDSVEDFIRKHPKDFINGVVPAFMAMFFRKVM